MKPASVPLCDSCAHSNGDMTCLAFPSGIPHEIIFSEVDHRGPYPMGDNGYQYEPDFSKAPPGLDPVEFSEDLEVDDPPETPTNESL